MNSVSNPHHQPHQKPQQQEEQLQLGNTLAESHKQQLDWYLQNVVPSALADMAILVQEALDALSSSDPSNNNCFSSSSTSPYVYSLPVSSDINDPISVKGSISISNFTILRSSIDIKFPSRSILHLSLDPCVVHPVMEAHHHASMILSTLQSTMPPFSYHTILALTAHLGSSLQTALIHLRHNHRTVGPSQAHPNAAPADLSLGVATALCGDNLVLTFASLSSHSTSTIPNSSPVQINRTSSSTSITPSTSNSHSVSKLAIPTRDSRNRSHLSSTSPSPISRTSTPPPANFPSSLRSHHSTLSHLRSLSSSPSPSSSLAGAKVRASNSIRSALSSVGVGNNISHHDFTSSSAQSSFSNSKSGSSHHYLIGNSYHEVQLESAIEIGWKPLVQFRDKLGAALLLNSHVAGHMNAFSRLVDLL